MDVEGTLITNCGASVQIVDMRDGNSRVLAGSDGGIPSDYANVDGPADAARFKGPISVAMDSQGNVLVADYSGVRRIMCTRYALESA